MIEAATALLRGRDGAQHCNDALAAFGLPPDAPQPTSDTLLLPELVPVVDLFIAMSTQWIVGPMGGLMGLRYEALPVLRVACGIADADWPGVLADLQLMEQHTLVLRNSERTTH